jgi:hypothetical protein
MLARVISHLQVGAQKKIVKGPAGCNSRVLIERGQGTFIMRFWIRLTMPKSILPVILCCLKKLII